MKIKEFILVPSKSQDTTSCGPTSCGQKEESAQDIVSQDIVSFDFDGAMTISVIFILRVFICCIRPKEFT